MIGYVYILVNQAFPDLVKIGRTTRKPNERADELYTTGTPGKFIVAYETLVRDCVAVEEEMHQFFLEQRYSESREFFKVSPTVAIEELQRIAASTKIDAYTGSDPIGDNIGFHWVYISLIAYPSSKALIRIGSLVCYEADTAAIENKLSEDLSHYYSAFGQDNYSASEIEILRIQNLGESRSSFKKPVDDLISEHLAHEFEQDSLIWDTQTVCGFSMRSDNIFYEITQKARALLHQLRETQEKRAITILVAKNKGNF